MISLLHLTVKIVKWTVITIAYLLLGLAKLVTILLMLIFMASRAGVRRLLDAKERLADDEPDQYDLGYPSRASPGPSRDAFDARWQRERDLLVAERRARQRERGGARVVTGRSDGDYYRSDEDYYR